MHELSTRRHWELSAEHPEVLLESVEVAHEGHPDCSLTETLELLLHQFVDSLCDPSLSTAAKQELTTAVQKRCLLTVFLVRTVRFTHSLHDYTKPTECLNK